MSGWLALLSTGKAASERAAISFFGIRGRGTIYYLAYALGHATFEQPDLLWSTVSLTILISILLHGATITPLLRHLDWPSGRDTKCASFACRCGSELEERPGVEQSVGSVGFNYGSALAQAIDGLFKAEAIYRLGPWWSFEAVKFATLE